MAKRLYEPDVSPELLEKAQFGVMFVPFSQPVNQHFVVDGQTGNSNFHTENYKFEENEIHF